jgi:hypothetical protein
VQPSSASSYDFATAQYGNGNDAVSFGTDGSAQAGGVDGVTGANNLAFVLGDSSSATAGSSATDPGSFDLAGVFGDNLGATATGANFLVDIAPFFSEAESFFASLL